MPLSPFTPQARDWFERAFAAPTPAQAQAWPRIAAGEHVLISAPTGSGKTLAAFLWGIDRLVAEPLADEERRTRIVYVSPLKALAYDVDRNLVAPIRGIGADVRIGVRTGDTPQRERAAMRRRPPDILITTPESLYLLLTSGARETLTGVEALIVDEIHAVAGTKRGSHLALSLERLAALQDGGRDPQRIGLSATQSPLEEIGRFLVGPRRTARIVDAGVRKDLDLRIHVPVESMTQPEQATGDVIALEHVPGGEPTRRSIWPAIYPEILRLVERHASTIVFVNNRRGAERLALRLNELANAELAPEEPPREVARAHHGSLAREEREVVEELLKAGRLPCLVATSSLELGIDMGAVDLVIQVESPKSVSRGLQRIGRAGHGVGERSSGRIFPKFRADLLECAVVARLMREGRIESTVVPRNALDVLAQQIVAIAAAAGEDEPVAVDELARLVGATHSYAELSRELLENVLDMLDGRYPSSEFAELRSRIVWDRVSGTIRPRRGAGRLAMTNAGTIPDRGLYAVVLPDGRRVGELDEEMVYEARPGQTFLLGASTWRIEEIGRDRVIVTPAPGLPGAVPFWRGDGVGRPKELGREIGAFARTALDLGAERLRAEYDLDERATRNLLELLREQQDATGVIPSDRTIVVERFRDEIGDWRLCVLSPYGGRVHAAWALALGARLRDELGLQADAIWSDDGVIVHLPDADEPPGAELVQLDPQTVEDEVVAELGSSALFGARFRENAARALLIPRAYPGRRTPLWQQRLKAQSLLEVARRYPDFPIVLETYRECLRDVLDVPGLREILTALERRELSLVEVETPTASPLASSLLFDYVATYMYEGDTPSAERRAAALSLDRELLRELLGQEELRELIDPGALDELEADLQHRSARTRAGSSDALHEVLRRVGDLTAEEAAGRVLAGIDAGGLLERLRRERRAIPVRLAGEPRWIAADDAGLYRDALGAVPPGGLPAAFLVESERPLEALLARWARTHGPFTTAQVHRRWAVDPSSALAALESRGELVRGELRPGGSEREWCDPDVLRRLRRASLAVLRREIEAVDARALAAFLPSWQGVDRHPPAGAGVDRLREVLVTLQGLALPVEVWERDVLPRRLGAYSPTWLDQLTASGELVWVGAGALGRVSGRVALLFREDAALIGRPGARGAAPEPPGDPVHQAIREALGSASCFFTDLIAQLAEFSPDELHEGLWDLVWAGEATNDAFAPLRAPRLAPARARGPVDRRPRAARRFAGRRAGAQATAQGRWSLSAALFEPGPEPAERRRALAELLLERYGVVTREQVLAEGVTGGFAALYDALCDLETLGICRRGYFVEGLGGAQFALPGAVERLRAQDVAGAPDGDHEAAALVIAATDPAQPYGAALRWPEPRGETEDGQRARRPQRVAGAYVVLIGAEPVLYVERGGRGLTLLVAAGDPRAGAALEALARFVTDGPARLRLSIERVDGEPVVGSDWEPRLVEAGFRQGPRRLTLSA
ncbi:MAG: DEAD/DEAH box helicase [Solirubrobacteraceae bacterium]|nr:DEAD/DEAH box helicase [Solirubrobacteraceae bacterium]